MHAKYHIIAEHLRQDIATGVYADRLPSERELARKHGTTITTLRRAQALLVDEGRLVKRQPHGTFIVEPKRTTIRVSLLLLMFTSEILDAIETHLHAAVPGVDIEFQTRSVLILRPCEPWPRRPGVATSRSGTTIRHCA